MVHHLGLRDLRPARRNPRGFFRGESMATRAQRRVIAHISNAERRRQRQIDILWNEAARLCDYSPEADLALWRAVIALAMDDATGAEQSKRSDTGLLANREKPKARRWLTDNSKDFRLVCDYADVSADQVMAQAKTFASLGWSVTRAVRAA